MQGLSYGRAMTLLAEEHPDRPAITAWEADGTERTVTRGELDSRTNQIARASRRRSRSSAATSGSIGNHELAPFLAVRLVDYKRPASYEFTDQPVRDDAGKVRRSALRADRLRGRRHPVRDHDP